MNACIRAVVRGAIWNGLEVFGVRRGYDGMIHGDIIPLDSPSVSNIIQRGGTILKSARSKEFLEKSGRDTAYNQLKKFDIDGIVAIGGDGTFRGAQTFYEEHGIPTIGIPGTIDNDLYGTDYTLGFDTAVNTALDAIDKIRDTANSHDRLFFIEVMGRDSGYIAIVSGIGGGAELTMVPETKTSIQDVVDTLKAGRARSKTSLIVVVAEGDEQGGAVKIAEQVMQKLPGYDTRVTILGHVQRGGAPTALDRILASRLGLAAVEGLLQKRKNVMVGIVNNELIYTPFKETWEKQKIIHPDLLRLSKILSI